MIDSYKPRDVQDRNSDQLDQKITMPSQIADALNALRILTTHSRIDVNRIFIIGMSRGGNPAFYSAWPIYQAPVNTNGAKFAGHILMYPGMCNIRYRADAGSKASAPIFFTLPDRDRENYQDVVVCERYAKELQAAGNTITLKEYKGTYHAWDGTGRRFRYEQAYSAKPCDMELQMTPVAGGGLERDARDFKKTCPFEPLKNGMSLYGPAWRTPVQRSVKMRLRARRYFWMYLTLWACNGNCSLVPKKFYAVRCHPLLLSNGNSRARRG